MTRAIRQLFDVWSDTRQLVLTAQIAAVYAAILIPFKVGIPLIPGFSELRPANAIPIVASLLFGPPAAWGSAFGNIIGDFFGTLGPGSFFGFIGNFCYGYIPYLLWGRLGPFSSHQELGQWSWRQGFEFVLVTFAASVTIALVIGWGVDLLGLVPFLILAPAIFFNNFLMALLLAPPLLYFLYPRAKRWGLTYQDLIAPSRFAISSPPEHTAFPCHPSGSKVMVEMQTVSFSYAEATEPKRPALDNLSLTIGRGETVAIMGASGAGKTSLCYTLNGLIPILLPGDWSGNVSVNGIPTTSRPVWRQADTVGVVFQDFETQLISTNVQMELAYPLEHLAERLSSEQMKQRMAQVLARVGLGGMEHRDPLTLSGGQRQRLVIASILVREPSLLVLDEPTTDLDPSGRQDLQTILANLRGTGVTLILVAHDPEEAVRADRICVLQRGKLVWLGPPRELFSSPQLPARYGLRPLDLAQCFVALNLPAPLTVQEAWDLADEHGLSVEPHAAKPLPVTQCRFREESSLTSGAITRTTIADPDNCPLIEVRHVSYEYEHGVKVLVDVFLTIRSQEFVAIIGQNGSGKTTLAQLLNGLQMPTEGQVSIDGQDLRTASSGQLAGTVGYVFQNPDHQIFAESVGEEVAFGPRNLGCSPDECHVRVAMALAAVGLDRPGILDVDPFSMTKGERQCVAVASVLAARPRILIFDEPNTGLDAEETDRMMQMIQDLNRQGHTIIMVTHTLSLVARYAQRCILMHQGRVLAHGSPREIFADPILLKQAGLQVPPLTRFAQRWGHTLLTVEEVRASLRQKSTS
jgi:energy-coupling factor transporter ATP-binding protein EcfA2